MFAVHHPFLIRCVCNLVNYSSKNIQFLFIYNAIFLAVCDAASSLVSMPTRHPIACLLGRLRNAQSHASSEVLCTLYHSSRGPHLWQPAWLVIRDVPALAHFYHRLELLQPAVRHHLKKFRSVYSYGNRLNSNRCVSSLRSPMKFHFWYILIRKSGWLSEIKIALVGICESSPIGPVLPATEIKLIAQITLTS